MIAIDFRAGRSDRDGGREREREGGMLRQEVLMFIVTIPIIAATFESSTTWSTSSPVWAVHTIEPTIENVFVCVGSTVTVLL